MPGAGEKDLMEEIARLKEALKSERRNLDATLGSMVDGVYTTDLDRNVTFWNKGAERITGYKASDVIGKACRELLGHMDENGISLCEKACPLAETIEGNEPVYGKNVYSKTARGGTTPVSVSCAPIVNADGKVVGAVEVFRDISGQKRLERQKADFYAMVTHDLKSPLVVILGYSELLLDLGPEKAAPRMEECLRAIHGGGERILSMIEDFLSLSRLESGAMPLNLKPASLAELLRRLHRDFLPAAAKKGIRFDCKAADGLPVMYLDDTLLERAVSNLITNALKFTPEGGTVALRLGLGEGDSVEIALSDTGPGIRENDLGSVFDMYYRSEEAPSQPGFGLGLAIVKAVAEAHGGRASVRSEYGRGSTFTITLPCRTAQGPGPSPAA